MILCTPEIVSWYPFKKRAAIYVKAPSWLTAYFSNSVERTQQQEYNGVFMCVKVFLEGLLGRDTEKVQWT